MRITRLGQGVDADRRARPRGHRPHAGRAARVPRGDGRARRRPGAHDRHVGRARRRQPRRLLRRRRGRASASGPSCSSGDEEGRAVVPRAPPPSSTRPTGRSSCRHRRRIHRVRRYGTDRAARPALSLDIGCVRLTEKYLEHDPPRPRSCRRHLGRRGVPRRRRRGHPGSPPRRATVRRLAGTVTTVAAVEIGLAEYDRDRIHHFRSPGRRPRTCSARWPPSRAADRIHNPGLEAGAGRRDRRRLLRARRRSCARSASTSASCRRPTSSTAWRSAAVGVAPRRLSGRRVPHVAAMAGRSRMSPMPRSRAHGPRPVQPVPRGGVGVGPARCSATSTPSSSRCSTRRATGCARCSAPTNALTLPISGTGLGRAWRRRSSTWSSPATWWSSASTACSASACATWPAGAAPRSCGSTAEWGQAARPAGAARRPPVAEGHRRRPRRDLHRRAQRRRAARRGQGRRRSCWSTASPRSAASRSRSTAGASTSPTAARRSASACRRAWPRSPSVDRARERFVETSRSWYLDLRHDRRLRGAGSARTLPPHRADLR